MSRDTLIDADTAKLLAKARAKVRASRRSLADMDRRIADAQRCITSSRQRLAASALRLDRTEG